jgi:hypothetical protein
MILTHKSSPHLTRGSRLLDSSDPKTNLATLTLIANSIRSSESRQ